MLVSYMILFIVYNPEYTDRRVYFKFIAFSKVCIEMPRSIEFKSSCADRKSVV